jgi:hypothetical protein
MQIINENTANVIPITDHVEKIKMFLRDEVRHYEEEYDVELPPIDDSLEETIRAIKETNTEHILYDFLSLLKYCISIDALPCKEMNSNEKSDMQNSGTNTKEGEHFNCECPYCNSKEVELNDQEYIHPDIYIEEHFCNTCDRGWRMVYDMTMDFDFYELMD